jgi:hypothetical protein
MVAELTMMRMVVVVVVVIIQCYVVINYMWSLVEFI